MPGITRALEKHYVSCAPAGSLKLYVVRGLSSPQHYAKRFYRGKSKLLRLKFNEIYTYALLLRSSLTVGNRARVRYKTSLLAAGAW